MFSCYSSEHGLTFRRIYQAISALRSTGEFGDMDQQTDEDEHSIEMHLPYIRKIFEKYDTSSSV